MRMQMMKTKAISFRKLLSVHFRIQKKSNGFHCSPGFMSAIMRRQVLHEMVKNLPKPVQGRISALKNVQLEQMNLEAQFYEEVITELIFSF